MARIAGVDIPKNKRVEIALTYIYGIGLKSSQDILGTLKTNTVNVGKRDFHTLVIGNINTSYTSHFDIYSFFSLNVVKTA